MAEKNSNLCTEVSVSEKYISLIATRDPYERLLSEAGNKVSIKKSGLSVY
jgi:hypothetical protein